MRGWESSASQWMCRRPFDVAIAEGYASTTKIDGLGAAWGIAVDRSGHLYIADYYRGCMRSWEFTGV